jgi:hypothetical protein
MKAKTQEKVKKMVYRVPRWVSREHAMHFVGLETGHIFEARLIFSFEVDS